MWLRIALILSLWTSLVCAASVQWNASIVDAEHGAPDGYRVYYGLAADQLTTTYDVGNQLNFPIPETWNPATYYFGVRAYNASGESGWATTPEGQTWVSYTKADPPIDPPSVATEVLVAWEQVWEQQMAIDCTLASATITYTSRKNSTVSKPTGVVDGDDMIAVHYIESETTVTPPSDWTLVTALDLTAGAAWARVYYKKAGASEPSSYTWSHSSAATQAAIKRFTGFSTETLLDCAVETNNGYMSPVTAESITTVTDGAALIFIPISYGGDNATGFTSPLVEYIDIGQFALAAGIKTPAGATGTVTATGMDGDASILMAIRPYASAGASAVPVIMRSYRARRN